MSKRVVALLGLALAGSQAGHLVAYQVRFGAAALQLQSSGAHAYFPLLVKTALGGAAVVLVVVLLMIGAARALAAGGRLHAAAGPSYVSVLATLFTLQLAVFMAQEVIEAVAAGVPPGSAINLLLWGILGQLPVALTAAAALRWLWRRAEAAAEAILSVPTIPVFLTTADQLLAVSVNYSDRAALRTHQARARIVKRGPPLSS
jgi:hypothetical protein